MEANYCNCKDHRPASSSHDGVISGNGYVWSSTDGYGYGSTYGYGYAATNDAVANDAAVANDDAATNDAAVANDAAATNDAAVANDVAASLPIDATTHVITNDVAAHAIAHATTYDVAASANVSRTAAKHDATVRSSDGWNANAPPF